ncbi:MAG: DUF6259 domain-containing protein [Pirellulales bacterium]
MNRKALALIVAWLALLSTRPAAGGDNDQAGGKVLEATLNATRFVLDRATGGILRMAHAGPGTMLETTAKLAGAVEVLYQAQGAEPIRLASRFTRTARVTRQGDRIVIHWRRLEPADPTTAVGRVSATVTLEPAADGRSVLLACQVENEAAGTVRQVLFPDLRGVLPWAGVEDMEFRTGSQIVRPFVELSESDPDDDSRPGGEAAFRSGGVNSRQMIIRWLDLGSLRGGLSIFPRRWGYDPRATVLLERWRTPRKLRLSFAHDVEIAPAGSWSSGQLVLTPHACGWAKGIEPYRDWAREKRAERVCSVPEHVRTGLGFRTIWMCRKQPKDPEDAVWRFRDLPAVAREARDHGLRELVVWMSHPGFELPLPPFYDHLGGDAEYVQAVAQCKKLGVNVVPFISVCQAKEKTVGKYRLTGGRGGWTYHPELIPRFNPSYATAYACTRVSTRDPVWQKEVLQSCRRLIDIGMPSLCWDQFFIEPPEPNLLTLTRQIRTYSRQRDRQSTFSAEELDNLEIASAYLDYTWNWEMNLDLQAVTTTFPAPRINVNIDASPEEVKLYFLRNRYLNIQPRKPDDINGSDSIKNHPALSQALRQCAKLRAQFLSWFVDGTLIGNCILSEPRPDAVVAAYVLPDKALILVLNTAAETRPITIACDLAPWLPPTANGYRVQSYDGQGQPVASSTLSGGKDRMTVGPLEHLGIALLEADSQ